VFEGGGGLENTQDVSELLCGWEVVDFVVLVDDAVPDEEVSCVDVEVATGLDGIAGSDVYSAFTVDEDRY
jgi:hypothetical protein